MSTDEITWKTELRKIQDLHPYPKNPRSISREAMDQLTNSIKKFGYAETIAIQPDGMIIAGHMRVKAMKRLGWSSKQIEVRVPSRELTFEEMREYLIRSNQNRGEWDYESLANDFDLDDLYEWGFTAKDLEFALDEEEEEDVRPECEKCPECGQKLKGKDGRKKA